MTCTIYINGNLISEVSGVEAIAKVWALAKKMATLTGGTADLCDAFTGEVYEYVVCE